MFALETNAHVVIKMLNKAGVELSRELLACLRTLSFVSAFGSPSKQSMTTRTQTRDWLLWSLSVVYLFGFTSLFVQAPGLFGEHGITPATQSLEKADAESVGEFVTRRPSLLRLLPRIGLEADVGVDFLCVAGIVVSFVAVISADHRNALVAALQWLFYLSIAQVGQIFLSSKWDLLLLETGFVAIFLAPLGLFGLHDWRNPPVDHSENHCLPKWLMRWILFRLIFAEGLTSLVNIFGMNFHHETTEANIQNLLHLHEQQILPTPAAWILNLLPAPVISTLTSLLILSQLLGSLLILLPSKKLSKLLFYWQCFCALSGIIFSNQGFYPLLVICLSLSLLSDDVTDNFKCPWRKQGVTRIVKPAQQHDEGHVNGLTGAKTCEEDLKRSEEKEKWKKWSGIRVRCLLSFLVVFSVLVCYGRPVMRLKEGGPDDAFVDLAASALHSVYGFVGFLLLVAMILGGTSLAFECIHVFRRSWYSRTTKGTKKVFDIISCLCLIIVTVSLFFISLVPLTWVNNQDSGSFLPNDLQEAYLWMHKHYRLVNNYMTISKRVEINGTSVGRLELILEGSRNQETGDWIEYSFRFKAGHPSTSPYIIAPHHPRLDESLWFAAQSNYKQHNWVLNLVYRLLNNQEEVLELLGENPFPDEPPNYIKASLYEYHFACGNQSENGKASSDWFTRKWISHYLPIISKSDPSFNKYLKLSGLIRITDNKRAASMQVCRETNILGTFLSFLRSLLGQSNGSCLCIVLILLGLLLALVDPSEKYQTSSLSSSSSPSSSSPMQSCYQTSADYNSSLHRPGLKEESRYHYEASMTRSRHPLG